MPSPDPSRKAFFQHGPCRWSLSSQPAPSAATPSPQASLRRMFFLVLVIIAAIFGFREYWNIYKNVARNYSGTEPLFNNTRNPGVIIVRGTAASGDGALQRAIAQGARYLALQPSADGERYAFGAQELSLDEVKLLFFKNKQLYLVLTGAEHLENVLPKLSLPQRLVAEVDSVAAYRDAYGRGLHFPVLRINSKPELREYMTKGMLRPHVISMVSLPASILEDAEQEIKSLLYSGVNVVAHDCEDVQFLKTHLGPRLSAAFSTTVMPASLEHPRGNDAAGNENTLPSS